MSYEDGGDFDIDQYYSEYEDLNKYKCSYCKSALESDDDCEYGKFTTTEEVIQLFNDSIFSNNRFVSVYPKSLLNVVLSFYNNYKHLLLYNKNYKGVLSFNVANCNIYGRLCCFQKLLALRGNFYKLMYSGLQFYLWRKKNINVGYTGINYNYPLKLNFKKSQSELDKYESLLMTVEVVDDLLLMSAADTPNISNSFSEKLVTILSGDHTQHYVDANKKYLFYYNKIYDKDDKLKTLEENKENIRDHLVSIFKEFLASENVYVKYLAPNYYQVSRDGTFGQNLMSMEDINFIHNNLINNITENYLISDISDFTFDMNYIDIIHTLEEIKFLNINLEYLQRLLQMINNTIKLNIDIIKKNAIIAKLKKQLNDCIHNNNIQINTAFCFSMDMSASIRSLPFMNVYRYFYGYISNTSANWTKETMFILRYIINIFKQHDISPVSWTQIDDANLNIYELFNEYFHDDHGDQDDCGCNS